MEKFLPERTCDVHQVVVALPSVDRVLASPRSLSPDRRRRTALAPTSRGHPAPLHAPVTQRGCNDGFRNTSVVCSARVGQRRTDRFRDGDDRFREKVGTKPTFEHKEHRQADDNSNCRFDYKAAAESDPAQLKMDMYSSGVS